MISSIVDCGPETCDKRAIGLAFNNNLIKIVSNALSDFQGDYHLFRLSIFPMFCIKLFNWNHLNIIQIVLIDNFHSQNQLWSKSKEIYLIPIVF